MSPDHLPVLVESLEPTDALPFSLFVALGDTQVLFRTQKDSLAPVDIEELVRAEKLELLTSLEGSRAYMPQLTRSVKATLDLPGDPEERLGECYRRGVLAAHHLMQNAATPEGEECATALSGTLLELLEQCAFEYTAANDLMTTHPDLAQHALQTCVHGMMLGRALGYPHLSELGVGLLLHDFGEVELEGEDRECRDDEGKARYEAHPRRGVELLRDAAWCSARVRDIVQNHHERLDGSGFPRGLRGNEISTGVRIAAIVDTFDERVNGSPRHEPRKSFEIFREMLGTEAGQFDAAILQAYVKLQVARAQG